MSSVVLKYIPRPKFVPFHNRNQRYAVLVCHRRAGKTYAAVNELVSRALYVNTDHRPNPFYGYVAPFRTQAKQIAWTILKDAVRDIPGHKIFESELYVKLPNGAQIKLFGADDPDSLRGFYFDGVILDEYGDMKSTMWAVVRPMLSDRKGWCVFMGTPKGKNEFYEVREKARMDEDAKKYFYLCLKASESGHLAQSELDEARAEMDEDEYEAEYECSFESAVKGSYYSKWMLQLEQDGQITSVPTEEGLPVYVAMDIGRADSTVAWFFQVFRGEIRLVDYYRKNNLSVDEFMSDLEDMNDNNSIPYKIEKIYLPHDAKAKTFASGKSTIEQILDYGYKCELIPKLSKADGIQAVRKTLPLCWFDLTRCYQGIEHLKAYQRKWDADKKVFAEEPLHDASSDSADAFRYLCLAVTDHVIKSSKKARPAARVNNAAGVNTATPPTASSVSQLTLDQLWGCRRRAATSRRI